MCSTAPVNLVHHRDRASPTHQDSFAMRKIRRGVVGRRGRGQGTGTPPHQQKRKNERRSVGRRPEKLRPIAYIDTLRSRGFQGRCPRAALNASLCLGLSRNSVVFRPLNGTQVTTKSTGERPVRHHIPQQGGDVHSRFLPFLSAAVERPASCADACLTCFTI